ncbi:hypothetical protein MUN76_02360 [Leucobacter rhizosphaerae]|uniref:SD-repeat containing protein B domain-containing protein n=1 Tax=Leucobacter rhizosphaerae TaxID=2932245 RepID=A0ABY4FX32_9MICO|nr:SdrD B-like domain-containing protein [Leucobacter rhizosphaerae]UOQ60847.1 hypothetical protein MUN76_02360 [Leucobacter rhizosphaerae]
MTYRGKRPPATPARRLLHAGALVSAFAMVAGLLSVPAAFAEETAPETSTEGTAPAAPAAEEATATTEGSEPGPETLEVPVAVDAAPIIPFAAGDGTLSVVLTQQTGTEPFQDNDDAGNDSGPDNDIVRTNDSVTYNVSVRFEGSEHTAPTITFDLPQGEELVSLPPFCLPGSSVTPASLPAPPIPVVSTSWESLPTQSVTCIVADQAQGTSLDYRFVSKVRPEVPNGTALTPVTATAASQETAAPSVSNEVSHSVSAAANFDVSKRTRATTDNSGPFFQQFLACTFDATKLCVRMEFPLTMEAPSNGKGVTPLASPIVVTEDLRPESFFGPGVTSSPEWIAAGAGALEKYAPRITGCSYGHPNLYGSLPNPWQGAPDNAVRDSGTITCVQTELGTPVDITFTDADTTAYTVPTNAVGGPALPADSGYVLATSIRIEVPFEAIQDLGLQEGDAYTLNWSNNYSEVQATAIDGSPNLGEAPENNVRSGSTRFEAGSGNFSLTKGFSGVTGAPGNTPSGKYTNWEFEGPPGSSRFLDGNTVVLPGQTVMSNLIVHHELLPLSATQNARSFVACDVWDNTKLAMPETFNLPATPYTRVQFASNGSPAWLSSVILDEWWTSADDLQNLQVEYGYTATPGSAENSDCDSGTWASTPGAVAGASVVDGTWQGVNRVRFSFSSEAGNVSNQMWVNFTIAMKVLEGAGANGTIIPNYASLLTRAGVHTLDEVVATPDTTHPSSYNPGTNVGSRGDRLIVGEASARIKKFVKNPTTGLFTDSASPQYTAGSTVEYRLTPSLTADASVTGLTQNVTVEDCLPRYQSFVSSARESGAPIVPVIVQEGSPAGAEVTCGAGQTYVKWDLGPQEINVAIDPIMYQVEIGATARNGVYTNTAVVASPGDPTRVSARTSTAQIQLVVPTGIKIAKTVDKPQVESNREGLAYPRSFTWTIDFVNIDSPAQVSDVDVIDVLPADGRDGSAFTGTVDLNDVSVSAGTGIQVLYTSAAAASLVVDPSDPSNQSTGATTWCDAATGGSVVSGTGTTAACPASVSEVTGLRFVRPGSFGSADEFTVKVTMTPQGNTAGDVYENRTSGRVVGVTQPVGPAVRQVAVIASAVGDRVWEDLNQNGLQDEGEPGVAGFPVRLLGTDVDGNLVDLETVTDADGNYRFENLASGTYHVVFDPNGLNSNTTFTIQHAGDDSTIDSDADTVTGETQDFALGQDTEDLTLDAGLIIDRNVNIVLDKTYLGATDLGTGNRTTVTYELTATNTGTAEGVYDLTDDLAYGGDITIGDVTARNTVPGGIATNPGFDGQTDTTVVAAAALPGGATHTYLVTVTADIATTITTEDTVCDITATETGSGFLNEAALTVDDVTVTDKVCGNPPIPQAPTDPTTPQHPIPGLPVTGGQLTGITAAALLLLVAGAAAVILRRRRHVEH